MITNKAERKEVLEYIVKSDFYSQDVYNRTIDSMMIEWTAHNHIYFFTRHFRVAHTDFDRNDEGVGYLSFWERAVREGIHEIF